MKLSSDRKFIMLQRVQLIDKHLNDLVEELLQLGDREWARKVALFNEVIIRLAKKLSDEDLEIKK